MPLVGEWRVAFWTAVASEARHRFGFGIRELTHPPQDFAATQSAVAAGALPAQSTLSPGPPPASNRTLLLVPGGLIPVSGR
jgi:hypothetical protein